MNHSFVYFCCLSFFEYFGFLQERIVKAVCSVINSSSQKLLSNSRSRDAGRCESELHTILTHLLSRFAFEMKNVPFRMISIKGFKRPFLTLHAKMHSKLRSLKPLLPFFSHSISLNIFSSLPLIISSSLLQFSQMSSDIPESFIPELQSRKLISPPSQSWLQKSWSSPSKKSSKTIRDSIYSPSTSNYSNDFNSKNTKKEERKPGRKIPPKNLKIFSNSHLVSESTGRFWNQDVKTPQSESFEIGSGNEFESSSPLMDEEMIRDFPSPPAGFIGLQLDDRYGGKSGRSSNESDARIRDGE